MRKIKVKILLVIVLAIFVSTVVILYSSRLGGLIFGKAKPILEQIQKTVADLPKNLEEELENLKNPIERIIAPPPLRSTSDAQASRLTKAGVFNWTNYYRRENNVTDLLVNEVLDRAAAKKLADMFSGQYFDHVSPEGIGPGEVVKSVGYKFILVGENLALGNFEDDKALVDAWMASPGHRENILNSKFKEVGIAVGKGLFDGRSTWLAVQTFATPSSVCPNIDPIIVGSVETKKSNTKTLENQLNASKNYIDEVIGERESLHNAATILITEGNRLIDEGNEKIKEGNRIYRQTGSREQAEHYWTEGEALQAQGEEKVSAGLAYQAKINTLTAKIQEEISNYNNLIYKFSALSDELKKLVIQYNEAVNQFNACLDQY